uniref:WGS project CBMG000000000 data, contig CS5907-c002056 n=1 Tax=Fusarium acuminatum CS5907 TaxID=1318461 RepID=A0A090M9G1_9HYPO|nr:unnamed protein product [Fusarium acuminatum CS5907]
MERSEQVIVEVQIRGMIPDSTENLLNFLRLSRPECVVQILMINHPLLELIILSFYSSRLQLVRMSSVSALPPRRDARRAAGTPAIALDTQG